MKLWEVLLRRKRNLQRKKRNRKRKVGVEEHKELEDKIYLKIDIVI